jgi:hypothetical protein
MISTEPVFDNPTAIGYLFSPFETRDMEGYPMRGQCSRGIGGESKPLIIEGISREVHDGCFAIKRTVAKPEWGFSGQRSAIIAARAGMTSLFQIGV